MVVVNASNSSNLLMTPGIGRGIPAGVWHIRSACICFWSLLILFGVIGNALTVLVLQYPRPSTVSTCVYLRALAIVDICFLLLSLGGQLVDFTFFFPSQLRQTLPLFCHAVNMLGFSTTYISVWLLVFVTLDRMFWVIFPFRARHVCTTTTAVRTIISIVLLSLGLNCHFFWTVSFQRLANQTICDWSSASFRLAFPVFDLLLVNVFPATIMIVANSLIVSKLRQMRRIRLHMKVTEPSLVQTQTQTVDHCHIEINTDLLQPPPPQHGYIQSEQCRHSITVAQKPQPPPPHSKMRTRDRKASNLTKMLLTTNIFFILSTLPLLLYDLVYWFVDVKLLIKANEAVYGPVVFGVERLVYTIWYLHFSVHFLLYCMSGPKFRWQALTLLGCKSLSDQHHQSHRPARPLDQNNHKHNHLRRDSTPLGASELLTAFRRSFSINTR